MTELHFVGDGSRDGYALPHLVSSLVGVEVGGPFESWHDIRVNTRKGYAGKLLYAIDRARSKRARGLVAVVDRDKAPQGSRLKELRQTRDFDRLREPSIPVAIGEADPHGEVWLLDDPVAVRRVLALAADTVVISVRKSKSPKADLDRLIAAANLDPSDADPPHAKIAKALDQERCVHAGETGFAAFVKDVRAELAHLAAS